MRRIVFILFTLIGIITITQAQRSGGRDRGGFSLSTLEKPQDIPDSLLIDTISSRPLNAFHITPLTGDPYIAPLDTHRLNFHNSVSPDAYSMSLGYLANIGSPAQTRIFTERKEARDFIFANPFDYYIITPENACFYDTKIPYTNILYSFNGSNQTKEERLKGVMTLNLGKKINFGGEMDYIYSWGHYASNGNKLLSYRLFGNYLTDRYEMRAYLSNYNFVNYENGGLADDEYITNPDKFNDGKREVDPKGFPTRYTNAFNRVRGKQYYLTHRYNLGFHRTYEALDEEEEDKDIFIPVASLIHTLFYEDNRRHFTVDNSREQYQSELDDSYAQIFEPADSILHDRPSSWKISNTLGLSLREGFQDWVKFGLTAYINFEKRQFKLPAINPDGGSNIDVQAGTVDKYRLIQGEQEVFDEFSTFIGAELSKRQGSILTYDVRGELGVVGDDLGEIRLSGNLETRFPLFKKEARVTAEGHIKNVNPAFFTRHYRSRYYMWDNSFKKERQMYAGGAVELESSRTKLSAGINNIENYVYFDAIGHPNQYGGSIQVLTARLKQDLKFRGFGWENEVVYQNSGNKKVLPLPEVSLYSNMYIVFKPVKVLTVQLGADVHYFTSYHAPYYEPATQQFQLQPIDDYRVKVGNFPIINAYANFHLKQARFFVSGYNLGTKFLDPNHFSLMHYPLNPFILKFGLAVTFNN